MIFPQESFVYRSQGAHSNPLSEDYGWRATAGGRNQWLLASGDGVITELRDGRDWTGSAGSDLGNYFTLKLANGAAVRLGHCQKGSFLLSKGQRVKKYQRICQMGNSGTCHGGAYHTHMTFWGANGRVVLPSKSGMSVFKDAVVYEGQLDMFEKEDGRNADTVGTPVGRNRYKDQAEVRAAVNARSNPNLGSTILGTWNFGIYDVREILDMTHEQSNGYVWYRLKEGWCARVPGVEFLGKEEKPVEPAQTDWQLVYEIAKRHI